MPVHRSPPAPCCDPLLPASTQAEVSEPTANKGIKDIEGIVAWAAPPAASRIKCHQAALLTAGRSVSERLKAATDELQKLEQLVVSGDCAPRVLSEFRGAVDSIRLTAWAVQRWAELQRQHRDPYTVLGILPEERVRRVTQLTRDQTIDLQSLELGPGTPRTRKAVSSH